MTELTSHIIHTDNFSWVDRNATGRLYICFDNKLKWRNSSPQFIFKTWNSQLFANRKTHGTHCLWYYHSQNSTQYYIWYILWVMEMLRWMAEMYERSEVYVYVDACRYTIRITGCNMVISLLENMILLYKKWQYHFYLQCDFIE